MAFFSSPPGSLRGDPLEITPVRRELLVSECSPVVDSLRVQLVAILLGPRKLRLDRGLGEDPGTRLR
jgi:hypothetical protein